jgi:GAF domain-containing protein
VDLGQCLCGKAAKTKKIVFKNKVDSDHTNFIKTKHNHGHYCVPLMVKNNCLGVLNVYISANTPYNLKDENFLKAVANTLAGVIQRIIIEEELRKSKKEFELKFNQLEKFNILTVDRELKMIELKKKIEDLEQQIKINKKEMNINKSGNK